MTTKPLPLTDDDLANLPDDMRKAIEMIEKSPGVGTQSKAMAVLILGDIVHRPTCWKEDAIFDILTAMIDVLVLAGFTDGVQSIIDTVNKNKASTLPVLSKIINTASDIYSDAYLKRVAQLETLYTTLCPSESKDVSSPTDTRTH